MSNRDYSKGDKYVGDQKIIITFPYFTRLGKLDEFKGETYSNSRKNMGENVMAVLSSPTSPSSRK